MRREVETVREGDEERKGKDGDRRRREVER